MRTPDKMKEEKILKFIKKNKEGTYVSEIARGTGITKSTVSYLLNGRLSKKVKTIKTGKNNFFKLVKLK